MSWRERVIGAPVANLSSLHVLYDKMMNCVNIKQERTPRTGVFISLSDCSFL
jgi:hypothetical protein